jgi:hypothetical protein
MNNMKDIVGKTTGLATIWAFCSFKGLGCAEIETVTTADAALVELW